MYRKDLMEAEVAQEQFVSRLYELPVINSAVGRLGALYTGTKDHNRLFRFTLETAESGFGLVVNTAKPVVAKFEKPIGTLNGMACQQLEKLEHDYPIITKPTDVVLKQTMETCQNVVQPITERIKPITTRVGSATQSGATKLSEMKAYTVGTINGVKSYGVETVNGVKAYGMDTVNGVKEYGINKFNAATDLGSRQMSRMLEHQTGQAIISKVDMAIDFADNCVEKYLPEEEEEKENVSEKSLSAATKAELDEVSRQGIVMTKAVQLGYKVRRRAYNHVAKQLKTMKMRSLETVDKLHFTVDLMEYARHNLDGVKGKVHYVWEEINKSPEQLASEVKDREHSVTNLTYERRAIATARHLTQKLKASLSGFNLSMEMVPAPVRTHVQKAIDLAQSLFQMFSSRAKTGLTDDDIANVKNSIGQIRTSLGSVRNWNLSAAVPPTVQKMIPLGMMTGATTDKSEASTRMDQSESEHSDLANDQTKNDSDEELNSSDVQDERDESHNDDDKQRDDDDCDD